MVRTWKGKMYGLWAIVNDAENVPPALVAILKLNDGVPAEPPENKIPLCFGIFEPIVIGDA